MIDIAALLQCAEMTAAPGQTATGPDGAGHLAHQPHAPAPIHGVEQLVPQRARAFVARQLLPDVDSRAVVVAEPRELPLS